MNKTFDLIAHLKRQRAFSIGTFGPGKRTEGVIDHIKKELDEVLENPSSLEEWIDIIILAFDGAWRAGHNPEQIAAALQAKQYKNENREWPDWRGVDFSKAIEHVKLGPGQIKFACGYCLGEGKSLGESCPRCFGTGYYSANHISMDELRKKNLIQEIRQCNTCIGTGKVPTKEIGGTEQFAICPSCKGSSTIILTRI